MLTYSWLTLPRALTTPASPSNPTLDVYKNQESIEKTSQKTEYVYTVRMRASDKAYHALREDIVRWRLPPGQR